MVSWERWSATGRVMIAVCCYPHHWGMHWRDNGGRCRDHTWATTLMIGPWQWTLMLGPIGGWSRLLWLLPEGRNGRGLKIGW